MKEGSLIECIGTWDPKYQGQEYPVKNYIYTIRAIIHVDGETGLHLEEIINPLMLCRNGFKEVAFNIKKFREIQPPMTIDINEIIKELV